LRLKQKLLLAWNGAHHCINFIIFRILQNYFYVLT